MNMALDLPFLNIYNRFTNEMIRVYLDKHSRMFMGTKVYCVKQLSHLSEGVVKFSVMSIQFGVQNDKFTLLH